MKRSEPTVNLLAGGVGGLSSLVVGHPFDTVKVRLQTMRGSGCGPPQYKNARDCLLKILRNEGAGTLFRGMSGLAYTSVPRFALIFYANSWGRLLAMKPGEKDVQLKHILLGGVFSQLGKSGQARLLTKYLSSAVVAPTVTAPMERVKVLLQVFPTKFSGQRDCLSYILRTEGWQGLFRGSLLTVARDIPAFCSYFATYETLRSVVATEEDEVGVVMTAIIGAISGVVGWAVELPADNVKNSYQVSLGRRSLSWTVRDILAQGGVKQLYR